MTHINASLRITNSHFRKNKADIGGSLFENSPKGFLKIERINVPFSYCRAYNGCTIFFGYNRSGPRNLFFGLRNVTVEQWNGYKHKCKAAEVFLKNGNVVIERSTFRRKMKITVAGALRVITTQGKTNVTNFEMHFWGNSIEARQEIFVQILAGNGNAGMAMISDSLIVSNI